MNTYPEVVCAGIVVADHVCTPIDHLPAAGELVMADRLLLTIGGCAANVAVDLAKMGVAAGVVGRVGGDVFGRVVAEMLAAARVDVSGLLVSPDADTSQTLIVNVIGQDRRFIHTFGANAEFRAADIPLSLVTQCRVFYVGGYLVMPKIVQDELIPIFAAARQAGARVVLDVVVPGPGKYLPQLDRLLSHVDVFLPNDYEAELLVGECDPKRQLAQFRRFGVGTVIITRGERGAVLLSAKTRLQSGAFAVPFVDGSGGGDAFAAGYICGMLRNEDEEGCLRIASALGASCVRAVGTTTGVFTRVECEEFLAQNTLKIERI
ncbi:MAG TPA: carbohydrate kinase family protein [Gemmataceae bacterium]|nr:carbohydrate kinase family protein [Gemmataceae bacterium]